jgi:hypothetical protein
MHYIRKKEQYTVKHDAIREKILGENKNVFKFTDSKVEK